MPAWKRRKLPRRPVPATDSVACRATLTGLSRLQLPPPQAASAAKNRRTALAFLRKLPPGRTALRRLFALLAVTVATALPPLVRRRKARPHRAAAAPAKSKRRRCPPCPRPLLPLCPPVRSPKKPQLSPHPKPLPPYPDEASLRHTPRTPIRLLFPDANSHVTKLAQNVSR